MNKPPLKTIPTIRLAFVFILFAFSVASGNVGVTNSYFADRAEVSLMGFEAGRWDEEVSPGDVIINEVMWMGSSAGSNDEWIELRNTKSYPIEIGQWRIENAKRNNGEFVIPAKSFIEANGFFLIANHPKSTPNTELNVEPDIHSAGLSLKNEGNGDLVLKYKKDKDWIEVDRAEGESWPAGSFEDGISRSMERNENSPDGGFDSWHTCLSEECNDTKFWKTQNAKNFGTPGAKNSQ
jgi:hypothetical protein